MGYPLTRIRSTATAANSTAGPVHVTVSATGVGNYLVITVAGQANSPGNMWNGNITVSDGHINYSLMAIPIVFGAAFGVDYVQIYCGKVTISSTTITISWSVGTFMAGSPFIIITEYSPASDVVIMGALGANRLGSSCVLNGNDFTAAAITSNKYWNLSTLAFSFAGGLCAQLVALSVSLQAVTIIGAVYNDTGNCLTWTSNGSIANNVCFPSGSNDGNLSQADYQFVLGAPLNVQITCGTCGPTVGQVGVAYSYTFPVTGGTAPYTFSIISGSLPPGLTLNTSTGVVSGTPTTAGNYTFTIKVVDANGFCSTSTCTIVIYPATGAVASNYAYYARS